MSFDYYNLVTIFASQAVCFIIGLIWGKIIGHKHGWKNRMDYEEELRDDMLGEQERRETTKKENKDMSDKKEDYNPIAQRKFKQAEEWMKEKNDT